MALMILFFLSIADLNIFGSCNIIQQIKKKVVYCVVYRIHILVHQVVFTYNKNRIFSGSITFGERAYLELFLEYDLGPLIIY